MSILKIGLTGGIASGKSEVSKMFNSLSTPIIDTDKIARNLFKKNSPLLNDLKARFGQAIFKNNNLDRKALGKIVFNSSEDLLWLNQLTHPLITKNIEKQLERLDSPYVIIDIPLLVNKQGEIPSHLKPFIDRVLVVSVPVDIQIQRVCSRDKVTKEDALAIINNQSSLEQKLALADDVIDNTKTLEELESQIALLHNKYLNIALNVEKNKEKA